MSHIIRAKADSQLSILNGKGMRFRFHTAYRAAQAPLSTADVIGADGRVVVVSRGTFAEGFFVWVNV